MVGTSGYLSPLLYPITRSGNMWVAAANNLWCLKFNELGRVSEYYSLPFATQFYYGYSCYRLGQNKSAWTELISFTEAYPQHVLAPPAFRMAVSAAVLLSGEDTENRGLWLERAEQSAAELIKLSNTFSDKRDACLLAASVSRDRGEYVKALAYIEPVTDFDQDSVPIIYFKALIYSDMERLTEADKTFKFIEETFPSSGYADRSVQRI